MVHFSQGVTAGLWHILSSRTLAADEHLNDLSICDDWNGFWNIVLLVAVQSSVKRSPHWYLRVKFLPEDFVLYASHCLIITPCSFFLCVYLPFDIAAFFGASWISRSSWWAGRCYWFTRLRICLLLLVISTYTLVTLTDVTLMIDYSLCILTLL